MEAHTAPGARGGRTFREVTRWWVCRFCGGWILAGRRNAEPGLRRAFWLRPARAEPAAEGHPAEDRRRHGQLKTGTSQPIARAAIMPPGQAAFSKPTARSPRVRLAVCSPRGPWLGDHRGGQWAGLLAVGGQISVALLDITTRARVGMGRPRKCHQWSPIHLRRHRVGPRWTMDRENPR